MANAISVPVSVNALITMSSEPSKVLLVQISRPVDQKGTWGLPGGKVDEGESLTQALHREVMEETGIMPDQYAFKRLAILHDIPDTACKHIYHLQLNNLPEFKFDLAEILQIQWFDKKEFSHLQYRAPWVLPLLKDFYSNSLEGKLYSQE